MHKDEKNTGEPIMDEWTVKMSEPAKRAKVICLNREGIISTFTEDGKPFMDFLLKMNKNELIY